MAFSRHKKDNGPNRGLLTDRLPSASQFYVHTQIYKAMCARRTCWFAEMALNVLRCKVMPRRVCVMLNYFKCRVKYFDGAELTKTGNGDTCSQLNQWN